jgi:hypothetical protein
VSDPLRVFEPTEKELQARVMEKTLIINDLFLKVELPRQTILELLRLPLTVPLRETLMEALKAKHLSVSANDK